eukprot:TRINITY_DN17329_c0_g1_i5.p1 TRINITY_DN17329_c0_g1~~TRINITY_DN17329_c0_g1_i5.p1  ORF type:complete len:538 (+),score=59.29 TRINITY_DN17329_c0_g1_i5:87-1700(+)
MIRYSTGKLGFWHMFQLHGSVFPKAFWVALPNAMLAAVLHIFVHWPAEKAMDTGGWGIFGMGGAEAIWSGYTFVLGFLIVFRNNQAYQRYWDGAMMISEIRGNWYHSVSNLIAFCSNRDDRLEDVEHFQYLLMRLVSMLFCACLQRICDLEDDSLEILDVRGIDSTSLAYISHNPFRCEVLMQWLQQHIVDGNRSGTLDIEAPILSRVFQELTNGIVQMNRVQNIKDVPFPFPYSQMITAMLVVHWIVTPCLAAQAIQSAWWASILCFCTIGSFWSLVYIAREIDQPFGDDANDLPVKEIMQEFNETLYLLLHPMTQASPKYMHVRDRGQGKQRIVSEAARWTISEGVQSVQPLPEHVPKPATQVPSALQQDNVEAENTPKVCSSQQMPEVNGEIPQANALARNDVGCSDADSLQSDGSPDLPLTTTFAFVKTISQGSKDEYQSLAPLQGSKAGLRRSSTILFVPRGRPVFRGASTSSRDRHGGEDTPANCANDSKPVTSSERSHSQRSSSTLCVHETAEELEHHKTDDKHLESCLV